MNRLVTLAVFLLTVMGAPAAAQDIAGQWQGKLQVAREMRTVVRISQAPTGSLNLLFWLNVSTQTEPRVADSVSLSGSSLKFVVKDVALTFEGALSADGKTIKGTITQGGQAAPVQYEKASAQTTWVTDPSPHKVSFITTNDNVKLEVLDWGGTGRPLLFISGLGATGHVFDKFALSLTSKYHVFAVTRRGFGLSDRPDPAIASYMADRLGDDVITVMDALKLERPVLAGWSMGGAEMSSIGSRYPEKVAGLVYLDAGYGYAYYSPGDPNPIVTAHDVVTKIQKLDAPGITPQDFTAQIDRLLKTDLPQLQTDLAALRQEVANNPELLQPSNPAAPSIARTVQAIMDGQQKYTDIKPPILALYAYPAAPPPGAPPAQRDSSTLRNERTDWIIKRFEAGNPKARVVRLANAQHAIFLSNPDEVIREMIAFIEALK